MWCVMPQSACCGKLCAAVSCVLPCPTGVHEGAVGPGPSRCGPLHAGALRAAAQALVAAANMLNELDAKVGGLQPLWWLRAAVAVLACRGCGLMHVLQGHHGRMSAELHKSRLVDSCGSHRHQWASAGLTARILQRWDECGITASCGLSPVRSVTKL